MTKIEKLIQQAESLEKKAFELRETAKELEKTEAIKYKLQSMIHDLDIEIKSIEEKESFPRGLEGVLNQNKNGNGILRNSEIMKVDENLESTFSEEWKK